MKSPLNTQQQQILVAFARIAEKANDSGLLKELQTLSASAKSFADVMETIAEAEPLWAVDLQPLLASKQESAAHDKLDWENRVFEAICDLGEVDRSDAQGIVEAKEVQGEDVLGLAWKSGLSAPRTARKILDMPDEEDKAVASLSPQDIQQIKQTLEELMRAVVRAGKDAGIIRADLESVSVSQCIQILDDLSGGAKAGSVVN